MSGFKLPRDVAQSIPLGGGACGEQEQEAPGALAVREEPVLSWSGLQAMQIAMRRARVGDDGAALQSVLEMTEDDVRAALTITNTLSQALMAVGTNHQFGRLIQSQRGEIGGASGAQH